MSKNSRPKYEHLRAIRAAVNIAAGNAHGILEGSAEHLDLLRRARAAVGYFAKITQPRMRSQARSQS